MPRGAGGLPSFVRKPCRILAPAYFFIHPLLLYQASALL